MGDSERWSSFDDTIKKSTSSASGSNGDTTVEARPVFSAKIFRNRLIFGSTVGFCAGATFSIVDHFRQPQGTTSSSSASKVLNAKSANTLLKTTATSSGLFAAFFCTFQGIKYGMELSRCGQDDALNTVVAAGGALAPWLRSTNARPQFPFMMMLVAMDYFHDELGGR